MLAAGKALFPPLVLIISGYTWVPLKSTSWFSGSNPHTFYKNSVMSFWSVEVTSKFLCGGGLQRTLERGYFELAVHTVEWAIRAERLPLHEKTLPTRLARDVKGHPVDCGGFLRLFARFFAIELDVIGQAASLHVGGLSGDLAARHGEQLDHRSSD